MALLFNDEFIENILNDSVESIIVITKRTNEYSLKQKSFEAALEGISEGYALLQGIFESTELTTSVEPIELTGNPEYDGRELYNYMNEIAEEYINLQSNIKMESMIEKFKTKMGATFFYEFTDGDVDRIQTIINELRQEISESELFSDEHKTRLLKRLEKMQAEIHKKMSDLDRFWGLIGEAGIVIGKFGEDVKPIVDRIREISEITWRTQSKAEELPSGTDNPMLPHVDEE